MYHRCSYCRCSVGRAACRGDPPARSSAGTYSAGAAALERNRSAAAMGFPCQCCRLKQQSGTTEHPTKGVKVLTGGQGCCMNRAISAPVECERGFRLGRRGPKQLARRHEQVPTVGCESQHSYFINRSYAGLSPVSPLACPGTAAQSVNQKHIYRFTSAGFKLWKPGLFINS